MIFLWVLLGLPIIFFVICFLIVVITCKYFADVNNVSFKEGVNMFDVKLKELKESLEDRNGNY